MECAGTGNKTPGLPNEHKKAAVAGTVQFGSSPPGKKV